MLEDDGKAVRAHADTIKQDQRKLARNTTEKLIPGGYTNPKQLHWVRLFLCHRVKEPLLFIDIEPFLILGFASIGPRFQ